MKAKLGLAFESDSSAVSNDEPSGDYLPMANIVHLITWRNAWARVSHVRCPVQCSLHLGCPSLSLDRGKMLEICESRIQG